VRRTVSLDGDWERRDFLDEAWRWSDALRGTLDGASSEGPPVQAGMSAGWRPARVPGSLLDDAWRTGEIPNPYVDRDSLAAEWIPQRTWLYRRAFDAPESLPAHASLRMEGIDPGGIVFLDGQEIARHEGMFEPLEVDLRGRLRPGERHTLIVAVDPAPWMPSQVSRTDLARLPRSRMGYGWDFCPRMITTGLWGSVELELYDARLRDPRIGVDLAADLLRATVEVAVTVDGQGAQTVTALLRDPDGQLVGQERVAVVGRRAQAWVPVERPRLWWPRGSGDAALHELEIVLEGADRILDRRTHRIGIRSVAFEPTGGRGDALPYTLVVNGRPTWIRGWNWVPMDAAFGVPRPHRLRHLVELLRRANVNLLRVWGGGLLESEAFYDACDAAGILVWQEFAQSSSGVSNTPADDPAFVERMRRYAEAVVPLRRNHPSLALWCGGNELAWPDGRPLDDRHPVLATLRAVVEREDPGRAWLPSSPSGPRFDNSLTAIAEDPSALHDVHGPWEHQGLAEQHALADATTSLLHSEFGVEGMTNLATLRTTVSDPRRWTADRSDPVMAHRGAWWNNKPFVERAFGGVMALEELERASQHLQADGLRTLIDGDRRRWPRNAGTLPWVFNEPFPNAWSNAAVDFFGVPKAAYHAVADAYAPIVVGLAFASQALNGAAELTVTPWVANDTDAPLSGTLSIRVVDLTGRCLDQASGPLRVDANAVVDGSTAALSVASADGDLLVLEGALTADGREPIVTRRLLSRTADLEPMRRLPPAELALSSAADGHATVLAVSVNGSAAAVEVRIADARPVGWPERSGAAYPAASGFTLLPGERRRVRVDWIDVPPDERRLRIDAWNVAAQEVTPPPSTGGT
jgi:beta-mannosidase